MRPALLARPRGARELHRERSAVRVGPRRKVVQDALERRDVGETVQPFRGDAQFARRLRAAQHQRGEQRDRSVVDVQHAPEVVRVAHHARAARFDHQRERPERVDRRLHFALRGLHHRVAVVLLVAAENERVEGQRIGVGNGALFLDQHAENPSFEERQVGEHGK
jgi:hypothetical protein